MKGDGAAVHAACQHRRSACQYRRFACQYRRSACQYRRRRCKSLDERASFALRLSPRRQSPLLGAEV